MKHSHSLSILILCPAVAHRCQLDDLVRVPHPRVLDPAGLERPVALLVVDAAREHLLAEGQDVWAVGQVEVLVTPDLAGGAAARLNLVHHEGDVILVGKVVQTLEKKHGVASEITFS